MPTASNPFPYFPEAGNNGFIYIGAANQDAQAVPVTVYRDEARTIPWAQPIRTVDGYPAYQGATEGIFLASPTYSITVQDRNGNTFVNETLASDPVAVFAATLATGVGAGLIGVSTTEDYPASTVGSSLNRFFNFTNPTFELQSIGPSTPPANGVYMGAGGNSLSFFTLVSSPSDGAEFDNQRGTLLVRAVTSDDGNSEEQSLCVLTTIQTGYTTPWAASTAYATLGTNVNNGGNTYRLIQAGTSAASGGPTGKTTNILDGTCRWMWINDSAINAKCGGYIETLLKPGAGSSWGIAINTEINAGVLAGFIVSQETDLTNNCGVDSTIGGLNKYNTYLQNNGGNVSTSVLDIGSSNSTNFSSIWGLHLTGAKLASNSVIGIDASSANGIGIGTGFGGAVNPTFTTAAIGDSSTAPKGIEITGAKSVAGIEITATTPASYVSGGTKTLAGFFDVSTAPVGLRLDGTYANDIISSPNFKVTATGNIIAKPAPTATPANNGEMTFELTSNTQLRIRVKGSDGTVRSASLTLS